MSSRGGSCRQQRPSTVASHLFRGAFYSRLAVKIKRTSSVLHLLHWLHDNHSWPSCNAASAGLRRDPLGRGGSLLAATAVVAAAATPGRQVPFRGCPALCACTRRRRRRRPRRHRCPQPSTGFQLPAPAAPPEAQPRAPALPWPQTTRLQGKEDVGGGQVWGRAKGAAGAGRKSRGETAGASVGSQRRRLTGSL